MNVRRTLKRVVLTVAMFILPHSTVRADDWPQWLGPRRDGVLRENGLVERFSEKGLAVRWRAPIGPGYAGPAVAGGRVYVTDRIVRPDGLSPRTRSTARSVPASSASSASTRRAVP